jgi:hypothetical protein
MVLEAIYEEDFLACSYGFRHSDRTRLPGNRPQGPGVLSNIYLHEVVDRWFEEEVKPRLGGRS